MKKTSFCLLFLALLTPVVAAEKVPPFPIIPTIVVPEIIGVQPAQQAFEQSLASAFGEKLDGSGISLTPARCEGARFIANEGGITRVDESGQVYRNSTEGVFRIDPSGAGFASHEGGVVRVSDDGSIYINGVAETDGSQAVVRIRPDGSGYYNGRQGVIRLDGQGGGYWNGPQGVVRINADGSAFWNHDGQVVRVNSDGSGYWNGPYGIIRNSGEGTGYWSELASRDVPMDPVPAVPPAGRFPAMKGFDLPGIPCGFVIILDDQVLFDFDRSDIRDEASDTLDVLASALQSLAEVRIEIHGHTDGKGSVSYNQRLSERRAQAVLSALRQRGSADDASADGFGKSRPVAPNEINGRDNPSGRQLNRRVEIYVRTG